jgi:hypothetical protein
MKHLLSTKIQLHQASSCCFLKIILTAGRDKYYQWYFSKLDEGCSPLHDITVQKMYLFLSVVQMGYDQRDTLISYWSTLEHFLYLFTETNTVECHILLLYTEISAL